MASARTLTVFCRAGLCNRLRLLISGLAIAEASGRTFRMFWPRTRACGAPFRELFVNDWPVTAVDTLDPAMLAHHVEGWSFRAAPGLLSDPRPDIVVGLNDWLIHPDRSAPPALRSRYVELLEELEPLAALRSRVEEFRALHFRPQMVGVHLRRGDFRRHRPDLAGNTEEALAALDRFLAAAPRAGIFLCTDDGAEDRGRLHREGLREIFRTRYGERVIATAPRSLDRQTAEGVQDAVVDLWLLRSTQMLVGTGGSSFSSLAVFGRDAPHAMVDGALPDYRRFARVVRLTGVRWLVRWLFRVIYGHHRPFPEAWSRLVANPLRRAKRRVGLS